MISGARPPLRDPLVVRPVTAVRGTVAVPGDKSISHRALFCGALAEGATHVTGWLPAEDCQASLAAVRALGVSVDWDGGDEVVIHGTGALTANAALTLDCGNSGTTMRLLLGLIAGQAVPQPVTLTGDASLSRRPMERVLTPLRAMGAVAESSGDRPPVVVRGAPLHATTYRSPIASAQVKSAVLLAGLTCTGETTVIEPASSRDHTERMLRAFGVPVRQDGTTVSLTGPARLTATTLAIPGDLSSAAFLFAAAAGRPGWQVSVTNCGCNPTRTGVLDALEAMGCTVDRQPDADDGAKEHWEPRATITVTGPDQLRATTIGGPVALSAMDELPMLAVLATQAHGRTVIRDAKELRVKESDRIAQVVRALGACGVTVEGTPDGFIIEGPQQLQAGAVQSDGDHRIAMSLAVAALWSAGPIAIHDTACIGTSFPTFLDVLTTIAPGAV